LFFAARGAARDLLSFPTRRSSDLEFNWACAVMKGKGADFVDQQSNRWEFKPDEQLNFGSAAERQAAEAQRLLQRCIDQNPGTPRSEEHTSELQSRENLVCRLLLEK